MESAPGTDIANDLPPGLGEAPAEPPAERGALRSRFGFAEGDIVFVAIGGDLVEQGVERLFGALGRLPVERRERCRVLALGRLARGFGAAIRVLGLRERTVVVEDGLGWRDAIEAGDVFVSLPYSCASNGWTIDAMAAGRAVLTHAGVAESSLVAEAGGGIVLDAPFRQADCDRAVADLASDAERLRGLQRNAAEFGQAPERYGRADELARRIENLCRPHTAPADAEESSRAALPA